MKKLISICTIWAATGFMAHAQVTVTPVVVCSLPAIVDQSSGLEVNSVNKIWTHNDGSGTNELYEMDTSGTLLRTLSISNATNVDWEDVTIDSSGNFYIGDFGNNNHNRQNLKIYKIINPDSITGNTTTAEVINFSYPDQTAFPPSNPFKNFDMEGMISLNHSLYLFSKNWTVPYSGYTKLYKLPDTAGTYVAQLLDSFYTGPGPFVQYSVTAADISPDNSRLILISNDRCWLFTNFTGDDFFSGTSLQLNISGGITQKEGVCFISNDALYLTDETGLPNSGNLYYLDLLPVISAMPQASGNRELNFSASPVPFSDGITIQLNHPETGTVKIEMFSTTGERVYEYDASKTTSEFRFSFSTSVFIEGMYFIRLRINEKMTGSMKLLKSGK